MPPYRCSVDIRPQDHLSDPTSAIQTRKMRRAPVNSERFSDLTYSRLITFTLEASDVQAARAQVEAMCANFLVNGVHEQATVTVTVTDAEAEASTT